MKRYYTTISCSFCRIEFQGRADVNRKFCSRQCSGKSQLTLTTKPCTGCGMKITRARCEFRGEKAYCSIKCLGSNRPKRPISFSSYRSASVFRKSKAIYGSCCVICGFDRAIDYAHIVPDHLGGTIAPSNILALCPNHHRLFDRGLLNSDETEKISGRLLSV